ncbi:unnamed protein product [Calicophoron daubneyi]|uniref:Calponin-homology (CH) domain-containing protein n=1 Tax=Calicophoron daubneyi TaxID=300641 RepID=A0AAV2TTU7_CALDB
MASELRAGKSGFAREVQQKLAEKFNQEEAAKTLRWIRLLPKPADTPEAYLEAVEKIPEDIKTVDCDAYAGYLSNGLVLGYLVACLDPDFVQKLKTVKTWQVSDKPAFETSRQRDRIGSFLKFTAAYGVDPAFQFQTDQLYESTNLTQVVVCLSQLGVEAQTKPDFKGPQDYWMHKHKENKRQFTEEQLRSGEKVIGLQMGTAAGANASGISFGAHRHITDSY